MERETAAERLSRFAKWAIDSGYVKTVRAFEEQCGLSFRYISNSTRSTNGSIGSDMIALVEGKYPMLNVRWLCTGKGHMVNDESTAEEDYKAAMLHIRYLTESIHRLGKQME